MDIHNATEQAYRNGYEAGKRDAKPKWIPATERLPDVNTNRSRYESKGVIVCIDGGEKISYRVYERTWIRGKSVCRWKYPWDTISDENITHWMPMPTE